jgi:hypothetical protein
MSLRGTRSLALSLGLIGLMAAPAIGAVPDPQADYRFNGNLKSSVDGDTVPKLEKVGEGFAYDSRKIDGKTDRFLKWEKGTALKLANASSVLGPFEPDSDYTIAMHVKIKSVAGYRKLVDFDNLLSDRGLYVNDGYLEPYNVPGFEEPEEDPLVAGRWHVIVITRTVPAPDLEYVMGYVDGKRYYQLADDDSQQELGVDEILHFFIDDETGGDEETGGAVSRIRIWQVPLTGKQAKSLGP